MFPLRTALVALLLSASVLPAQRVELATIASSPELETRSLVRVRRGPLRLTGRVAVAAGDTLILRMSPLPVPHRVALTPDTRLLVSMGPASRVRGALIGAGVGGLVGVFVGAVIVNAFDGSGGDAVGLSAYFFPYTVPAGAAAGAIDPGHRWVRASLTQR